MKIGTFEPTTNAEDFLAVVEVLDDDTGTYQDLSTAFIEIEVRNPLNERKIYITSSSGRVSLTATGFEFTFLAAEMSNLSPGTYVVNMRITDGGVVSTPFIASLPVLDGGFSS